MNFSSNVRHLIVLIVAAGFATWYYYIRGESILTEGIVRDVVDRVDAAYAAGDTERQCELFSKNYEQREWDRDPRSDEPLDFEHIAPLEYPFRDRDANDGAYEFIVRSRDYVCDLDNKPAAYVAKLKLRRTQFSVSMESVESADGTTQQVGRYLARYVQVAPIHVERTEFRKAPRTLEFFVVDEAGIVTLENRRPVAASSQTLSRHYWLREDALAPDEAPPTL